MILFRRERRAPLYRRLFVSVAFDFHGKQNVMQEHSNQDRGHIPPRSLWITAHLQNVEKSDQKAEFLNELSLSYVEQCLFPRFLGGIVGGATTAPLTLVM